MTQLRKVLAAGAICLLGFNTGCENERTPAAPSTPKPGPPPVVKAPPVLTRPYEEGYAAGFVAGKADGKPRADLPEEDQVDIRATEAAGSHPDRNLKWQRGWASGYMDGFRKSSEGRK